MVKSHVYFAHLVCASWSSCCNIAVAALTNSNHQSNTIKLIKDLSLAMLIFVTIIIIELVFYRLTLIRTISFFWHCFGSCWSSSHRSGTRDGLFSKTLGEGTPPLIWEFFSLLAIVFSLFFCPIFVGYGGKTQAVGC